MLQPIGAQSVLKVTTQNINLRELPNVNSKRLSIIPIGTTVNIEEDCNCDWIPVKYENKIGYIITKHLIPIESYYKLRNKAGVYKVTSLLNIRSLPSIQSTILGKASKGQVIYVENISGDWAKIIVKNGSIFQTAYINIHYIEKVTSKQINYSQSAQRYYNISNKTTKYYTNVDGEKVQSPTHYDSAPKGATALCRDGTYSFSRNRKGTCSHHGGVAKWL